MISIYQLKPKFQNLLLPVLDVLHKKGVTANQITLLSLACSALIGLALFFVNSSPACLLAVPLGLFVRMALNALDGMMARTYHMQSTLGMLLNEFGDVLSDILIYLPLAVVPGIHLGLVYAFVLAGVLNEFAGVLAKVASGTRRYDGPMGKSDRAFFVGALCTAMYFYPPTLAVAAPLLAAACVLIALSSYLRLSRSWGGQ